MKNKIPLSRLALWFAASRLFIFVVAALSLRFVPKGPAPVYMDLVDWFNHWDAAWYLRIADTGYFYDLHEQSAVVFFPLYPLLVHLVGYVIPDYRIAGYLISNGFLFASCLLLWKVIVRDYQKPAVADWSVLFLLLGPMTVFYSSIYTESIFLFLMLAVAYFATAQRWLAAGAVAFLGALTRPPGILLGVVIAAEYGARFLPGLPVQKNRRIVGTELARVLIAIALPELRSGFTPFISTPGSATRSPSSTPRCIGIVVSSASGT